MNTYLRRVVSLCFVLAMVIAVVTNATPARAQSESWDFVSTLATGCDSFETLLRMTVSGITNGQTYHYDTVVSQGSNVYMAQRYTSSSWGPTTDLTWAIFPANELGLVNTAFPMQPDEPIRISFTLRDSSLAVLDTEEIYPYFCNTGELQFAPGCDALIAIPETAVGGLFVGNAPVYWAPGELTSPLVVIEVGNTARVIGVDASGEYYQILWGCQFLWVPFETLAPNPDAVWNSAPLPANVVK